MTITESHSGVPGIAASDTDLTSNDSSYIDWAAILAGVVLASAVSLILLTFGSAIGLSMTSAREGDGASLFWISIIGGLWILWVQLIASFAGGYLTGRMRRRVGDASESESDIRDGSNGLVMWGLATLVAATLAWSGVSGVASAVGQAAGAVASAAGGAADAIDPSALLIDRTLRGAPGAPAVSEADRDSVKRIIVSAVNDGALDPADQSYLVATVAQRAGIPPEEAQARVDQIVAQANEVEQQARAAAERARVASVIAAFLLAASLLVGAVVAYYAATRGGNHRDGQTEIEGWYRKW